MKSEMDFHCQRSHDNRDDTASRLHDDSVNGPGIASFPAGRFAEMWVKEGRHAADDPPQEGRKRRQSPSSKQTVFLV